MAYLSTRWHWWVNVTVNNCISLLMEHDAVLWRKCTTYFSSINNISHILESDGEWVSFKSFKKRFAHLSTSAQKERSLSTLVTLIVFLPTTLLLPVVPSDCRISLLRYILYNDSVDGSINPLRKLTTLRVNIFHSPFCNNRGIIMLSNWAVLLNFAYSLDFNFWLCFLYFSLGKKSKINFFIRMMSCCFPFQEINVVIIPKEECMKQQQ